MNITKQSAPQSENFGKKLCENFNLDEENRILSCQTSKPVKAGDLCPDCNGEVNFRMVLSKKKAASNP